MVLAGYDPDGMVETMQILQELQEERPVEFFSTHPNPENREAYLKRRIQAKYSNLVEPKIAKEDYHKAVLEQLDNN